ncbi:MAG: ferritin-like domain-containing protein [Acidobacteria bacterium]|nr:MAG: ferritin-like domain-containing protein [Acidobacteriota bacterium]
MPAENLQELFVNELRDIYDAEKQLTRALPKMAKAAASEELRAAFEEHLEVTRKQVSRLEQVFKLLGMAARGKPCEGMKGLIEEGGEVMEEMEGATLDAALIASAQKVEHYEIAAYGTLATFAEVLEMQEAKNLLGQTLEEEKEADEKLTAIASQINPEAEQEEQEEEGRMATAGSRANRGSSSSRGKSARSRKR